MCGIVGYISKFERSHEREREKFLIEGLVMDTLRGWDSTGLIWVDKEFDVGTMRNTQPGPQFVRNKKFVSTDTNGWACIGHNRAATRGSVSTANAHPFRFGDVALVHNGTLRGWKSGLPATNAKIEVDSAMVAYNLSLVGPDEVDKVLSVVEGDFAFVWTDARDQSINFVRNSGRPLHLAESKNGNLMYFMSEAGMLNSLSDRQKNQLVKIKNIFSLETHKHLKFKKGSLVPEVRAITPFVRKQYSSGSTGSTNSRNAAYNDAWKDAMRSVNPPRTKHKSSSKRCGDNLVPLNRENMGRRGGTYKPINPIMADAVRELYQLEPHTRMSFVPEEYIPWDKESGMVRGMFTHEEWGDSPWEGVIYDFNAQWNTKDRMSREWTVSPIGLASGWNGPNSMPPVMLCVHEFAWNEPEEDFDDEIPFDSQVARDDDYEQSLQDLYEEADENLGKELFFGPNDKLIFREHIQSLLQYGCCYCGSNLTEEEHEDIMWVGMQDNQPLCLDCQNIFTDPEGEIIEGEIIH